MCVSMCDVFVFQRKLWSCHEASHSTHGKEVGSAVFASDLARRLPRDHSENCETHCLHLKVWKERSVSYCATDRDKMAHGFKVEGVGLGGGRPCRREEQSGICLGSSQQGPQELRGDAGSLGAVEAPSTDSWKREASVRMKGTPSEGPTGDLQGAPRCSLRKMISSKHLPYQEKTDLVLFTIKQIFPAPTSPFSLCSYP